MKAPRKTIEDRFWQKVDRSGGDDACWPWTAYKWPGGYGLFWREGKNERATRVALELSGVAVPDGMLVCHRCDNPPCVNPRHLFVGTSSENAQDMHDKGRARNVHGRNNPNNKLTECDVAEIRALKGALPIVTIGRMFGVCHQLVSQIHRNKIWQGVGLFG